MTQPKPRILIVKLSAIGDVVHTLPALNALRRHWPEAHITWLVEEAAADLVVNHPSLDRVLVSKRKSWARGLRSARWRQDLKAVAEFIRMLRNTHYDMVFDFQAALKGAMLIALIRSNRKIGFGPGMQHQESSHLVLNEKIPMVSMEIHALKRNLIMLEAIGIPEGAIEYKLPIDETSQYNITRLLEDAKETFSGPPIAINPMAKWETKLWVPERFSALADKLIDTQQAPVFFTGSRADRPMIDKMMENMRNPAYNIAGQTTLIELAALYQRMAVVISTDTGPMHIAAAVDTPVLALFGPTAEWRTGPYGEIHQVVATDADCRPCFKRKCSHCKCMQEITTDDVFDKIAPLLS